MLRNKISEKTQLIKSESNLLEAAESLAKDCAFNAKKRGGKIIEKADYDYAEDKCTVYPFC